MAVNVLSAGWWREREWLLFDGKRLTIPTYSVAGLFWWTAGMRANQEIAERKRRSREEIKRLVSEFEGSALRPAEFCRNHGLALSILQRHLKRRRLQSGQAKVWGEQNRARSNRWVAVELARRELDGNRRPACALKIVLSSGCWIEVEPDFDSETLARIVRILEGP